MNEAGFKLRRARERLHLRVRDVEQASQKIAQKHHSDEFAVLINRISEIENRGVIPSIYKLYSLCAIYRLDFQEVLTWYGVDLATLPCDGMFADVSRTHPVGFQAPAHGEVTVPLSVDPGFDPRKTTYLSRVIQRWGRMPLMLLEATDPKNHRYAFLGTDDWFMYPLLPPGSLVMVDETRRKILQTGWANEFERPIYFFEHRTGFACGWCTQADSQLVLMPHPSSGLQPQIFSFPSEIDVVGQVTGIAMNLDLGRKRRTRS